MIITRIDYNLEKNHVKYSKHLKHKIDILTDFLMVYKIDTKYICGAHIENNKLNSLILN